MRSMFVLEEVVHTPTPVVFACHPDPQSGTDIRYVRRYVMNVFRPYAPASSRGLSSRTLRDQPSPPHPALVLR